MGRKRQIINAQAEKIESMQHLIDSMHNNAGEVLELQLQVDHKSKCIAELEPELKRVVNENNRISEAYGQMKVRFEQAITINTINCSAKDAAQSKLEDIKKVLHVQSLTSIARVRRIKNILK